MIRIFALLLALFPFSVTVIGQQGTAAQDATVLRVSRVILYKTGIGYFDAIEREIEKREEEVAAIARDQARVRDNMAVLKGSSSERQLLQRYTRQLDAQETRLNTLQRELATYTAQRAQAERELAERIAAVRIDLAL